MADRNPQSLDALIRQNDVVYAPIPVIDLETGMVMRAKGRIRSVISVVYENSKLGPVAMVEALDGIRRVHSGAHLDVWHINGKPFIVDEGLPLDIPNGSVTGSGGGGAAPLAQDAAGIVPVWRAPKRPN